MSNAKGVAVILAPNETIHHGQEFSILVTTEDGSEELAQQNLMNRFARTTFGHIFPDIDPNDAWALWQIAKKQGFQIKMLEVGIRTIE